MLLQVVQIGNVCIPSATILSRNAFEGPLFFEIFRVCRQKRKRSHKIESEKLVRGRIFLKKTCSLRNKKNTWLKICNSNALFFNVHIVIAIQAIYVLFRVPELQWFVDARYKPWLFYYLIHRDVSFKVLKLHLKQFYKNMFRCRNS